MRGWTTKLIRCWQISAIVSRRHHVIERARLDAPVLHKNLSFSHEHLWDAASIAHYQQIFVDVCDVEVTGVLNLGWQGDVLSQNDGRFIDFGKADTRLHVQSALYNDIFRGSTKEFHIHLGLNPGLLSRNRDLQFADIDQV